VGRRREADPSVPEKKEKKNRIYFSGDCHIDIDTTVYGEAA
jgi:hypothetical protein